MNQRHTRCEDGYSYNQRRELPCAPPWDIFVRRDVSGTFEAFRRHFKGPSYDYSNGETQHCNKNDQPDDKIWNLEEWKDLSGDLDQKPRDNAVSDRDSIDVAPLQFGKKLTRTHARPI